MRQHRTPNLEILRCATAHQSSRFACPGMTGERSASRLRSSDRQRLYKLIPSPHRSEIFFSLAKALAQAEHGRLPTQSRAELQMKEAANGTRRQKSPWSTVHRTGGPFPKR